MEDLNKALQAIGSEVYGKMNQAGAGPNAGAAGAEDSEDSNGADKVVDAEFEDKGKKK
jgi:hypothetical protein